MRQLGELEPITNDLLVQDLTTRPTNMLIASFACLYFIIEERINKQILLHPLSRFTIINTFLQTCDTNS